jgi:hypothetical protein
MRLGEVDNLGDMINYGYGFFNVVNKENDNWKKEIKYL